MLDLMTATLEWRLFCSSGTEPIGYPVLDVLNVGRNLKTSIALYRGAPAKDKAWRVMGTLNKGWQNLL